jgi:hypothetical protein
VRLLGMTGDWKKRKEKDNAEARRALRFAEKRQGPKPLLVVMSYVVAEGTNHPQQCGHIFRRILTRRRVRRHRVSGGHRGRTGAEAPSRRDVMSWLSHDPQTSEGTTHEHLKARHPGFGAVASAAKSTEHRQRGNAWRSGGSFWEWQYFSVHWALWKRGRKSGWKHL